jgi:phosphoribosylformylglycinamidine (FGAM) synthase PurS component
MSFSVNVQAKPELIDPEAEAALAHIRARERLGHGQWT